MSGVSKEGFLFVTTCNTSRSQLTTHLEWNRRWLQLCNNGILKCYESCFADNLVFSYDLKSLEMSVDDLVYPDGVSGKPWIISVGMKERCEKLLLEADCEECMERWAELITRSLATDSINGGDTPAYIELMESPVETNCKGQLQLFASSEETLDSRDRNEYEVEDIITPVQSLNKKFPFGELKKQEPRNLVETGKCFSKIEDLYYTKVVCEKVAAFQNLDRKLLRTCSLGSTAPGKEGNFTNSVPCTSPCADNINRYYEIPSDNINRYYEIPSDTKSVRSLGSLDDMYETIDEIKLLQGESMLIESRRRRAFASYENLDDILNVTTYDQWKYAPGVYFNIFSSGEVDFLDSLPNYHKLLCDSWLMCFILPNGKVYKQLTDLTLPIQTTLMPLLKCFQCTSTRKTANSYNSFLSIQVIGDLYQTYNADKVHRAEKKKGMQSLNWEISFSSQGVVTSKIVQLIMRVSENVKLDTVCNESLIRF